MTAHRKYSKRATIPIEVRFWKMVKKTETCWLWTGRKSSAGYGNIMLTAPSRDIISTHRLSYILEYGEIPPGAIIMHTCDVRHCVNPRHLIAGDNFKNMQDCVSKNRLHSASGERHYSAKLTESKVIEIKMMPKVRGSQTAIAKKFGVSLSAVNQILRGISWKQVQT